MEVALCGRYRQTCSEPGTFFGGGGLAEDLKGPLTHPAAVWMHEGAGSQRVSPGKGRGVVLGRCWDILCGCGYLDELPQKPEDSTEAINSKGGKEAEQHALRMGV